MTKIYNRRKTRQFRQKLKQTMTQSEVIFWNQIKNDSLGYRFRRQYGIGLYIADFYCPKLKIAIEIDGATHHEESVFNRVRI